MIYTEKDLKSGKEYQNDLCSLPFVSFPKDTLILATSLLTPEQLGNVITDVVNDLFCGERATAARDTSSNAENVMYDRFIDNIGRLSVPYFKKIRNLKNQNKGE